MMIGEGRGCTNRRLAVQGGVIDLREFGEREEKKGKRKESERGERR